MSYLLDALRRAERERQGERPLNLQPGLPIQIGPTRSPRLTRHRLAIGAALGLVIGASLWFLGRRDGVAHPTPTEPAVVAALTEAEPAPNYNAERLDDLLDTRAEPAAIDAIDAANVPAVALAPALPVRPTPPPPPSASTPRPVAPAIAEPEPIADDAPLTMAEQALGTPSDDLPPEAKPLKEMPPDFRGNFPPLRIDVHAYDSQPERRFVIINGRKYREGEVTSDGPTVASIEMDGVVARYNNQDVLIPIGR